MKSQIMLEDIRKRPGMYVGYGDIRGVYVLIFSFLKELIDNNRKKNIFIEIHLDSCDTLRITCDGLTGINDFLGLIIIRALSCDFSFSEKQDSFSLTFKPDKKIFMYDTIEYYQLFGRLKELAQLNNNIKFLLSNDENKNIIHFQHGIQAMLMEGVYEFGLAKGYKPLDMYFVKDNLEVSVSMIYAYASDVALSYVNNDKTQDGGTHVQGLLDGIYYAFQEYIQNTNIESKIVKDHSLFFLIEKLTGQEYVFEKNPNILKDDVVENLNFVIDIKIDQQNISPMIYFEFSGNTKRELTSKEIYTILETLLV